jgi:hypothetical protein
MKRNAEAGSRKRLRLTRLARKRLRLTRLARKRLRLARLVGDGWLYRERLERRERLEVGIESWNAVVGGVGEEGAGFWA